jgi:hypothetical protein
LTRFVPRLKWWRRSGPPPEPPVSSFLLAHGRPSALRTLTRSAAERSAMDDLHQHVIDSPLVRRRMSPRNGGGGEGWTDLAKLLKEKLGRDADQRRRPDVSKVLLRPPRQWHAAFFPTWTRTSPPTTKRRDSPRVRPCGGRLSSARLLFPSTFRSCPRCRPVVILPLDVSLLPSTTRGTTVRRPHRPAPALPPRRTTTKMSSRKDEGGPVARYPAGRGLVGSSRVCTYSVLVRVDSLFHPRPTFVVRRPHRLRGGGCRRCYAKAHPPISDPLVLFEAGGRVRPSTKVGAGGLNAERRAAERGESMIDVPTDPRLGNVPTSIEHEHFKPHPGRDDSVAACRPVVVVVTRRHSSSSPPSFVV